VLALLLPLYLNIDHQGLVVLREHMACKGNRSGMNAKRHADASCLMLASGKNG